MPYCDGDVAEAVTVYADNLHHCSADCGEYGTKDNHSDEEVPYPSAPGSVGLCFLYVLLAITNQVCRQDIPDPE